MGTTLLELRCWNYVVGTALWELGCGNYVVGTTLWELGCYETIVEDNSPKGISPKNIRARHIREAFAHRALVGLQHSFLNISCFATLLFHLQFVIDRL